MIFFPLLPLPSFSSFNYREETLGVDWGKIFVSFLGGNLDVLSPFSGGLEEEARKCQCRGVCGKELLLMLALGLELNFLPDENTTTKVVFFLGRSHLPRKFPDFPCSFLALEPR